jgi:hypothetical protein
MVSGRKQRQRKRRLEREKTSPARVNVAALAPYNSYGEPDFVRRGYYEDRPFICAECHTPQVWRAWQQKWWYEVAKGYVDSTAKLCRPCRRREQARRAEARRVHLEGMQHKTVRDA